MYSIAFTAANYICKKLHLIYLREFWMRPAVVVNAPANVVNAPAVVVNRF